MINLFFEGRIKNRKKYEAFACDVINELLPREFKREIDIHVRFAKDIGACGWCHLEDEDLIAIEIDTLYDADEVAQTLAHELVHAKQYIRGEINGDMTRWMKQEIVGDLKYKDQPWEVEAFEKEKWLKEMYW